MAYLDLILRSVTEPALLKMFIKFLLDDTKFDGDRILDVLVDRLMSPNNRVSDAQAQHSFANVFTVPVSFSLPISIC